MRLFLFSLILVVNGVLTQRIYATQIDTLKNNGKGTHLLDSFLFCQKKSNFSLKGLYNSQIFEGKNSHLLMPDAQRTQNFNNLSRSIFKEIPGLNIWEYDGSGVQINIGARGLSPNRNSNINTRQNGYDISADAYGYPEAYFSPPAEALQKIVFSRGSFGLQNGPHFGGSLDFIIKEGEKDKLKLSEHITYGSNNFRKSYTSLGGSLKNWKYFGYFQKLQTNGFIPRSKLDQNVLYLSSKYTSPNHWDIATQYTNMNYLTQQPGGLTDSLFKANPYQGNRSRNWMSVNWHLFGLIFNKYFNEKNTFNLRLFALDANRKQVGTINLTPEKYDDYNINRDLKVGNFNNLGFEARYSSEYKIRSYNNSLLMGIRLFSGETSDQRGFSTAGDEVDFDFLNTNYVGNSSFLCPSINSSFFAENIFRINNSLSITPGIRYEFLQTEVNGYFLDGRDTGIFTIENTEKSNRDFPLFGIGINQKLKSLELQLNFTQNYRAVNFSDVIIRNPNLLIDSELKDESGFNFDIVLRGFLKPNKVYINFGLFYLDYRDIIGTGEITNQENISQPFKTNIGQAYSRGIESLCKVFFDSPFSEKSRSSIFFNYSFIQGKYTKGNESYVGNQLEYLSPHILKTGFSLSIGKRLTLNYQYSYQSKQFSDAKNTLSSSNGLVGIIPSFSLHDCSIAYKLNNCVVKFSGNNLLNKSYFTRRASGFPGPGIISGIPRSLFATINYNISALK